MVFQKFPSNDKLSKSLHRKLIVKYIHVHNYSCTIFKLFMLLHRVAAAAELTELHDRMNVEVKKLQDIHTARYSRSVLYLRINVVHVLNIDQKEVGTMVPRCLALRTRGGMYTCDNCSHLCYVILRVGLVFGWSSFVTERWS